MPIKYLTDEEQAELDDPGGGGFLNLGNLWKNLRGSYDEADQKFQDLDKAGLDKLKAVRDDPNSNPLRAGAQMLARPFAQSAQVLQTPLKMFQAAQARRRGENPPPVPGMMRRTKSGARDTVPDPAIRKEPSSGSTRNPTPQQSGAAARGALPDELPPIGSRASINQTLADFRKSRDTGELGPIKPPRRMMDPSQTIKSKPPARPRRPPTTIPGGDRMGAPPQIDLDALVPPQEASEFPPPEILPTRGFQSIGPRMLPSSEMPPGTELEPMKKRGKLGGFLRALIPGI